MIFIISYWGSILQEFNPLQERFDKEIMRS
jgi:hypothetical protein